ncbi:MAG: arginine deiminase family protein [Desulfuromusa sp.]|nr:arginine deiminase family protein [Desulfuromusa sp.]
MIFTTAIVRRPGRSIVSGLSESSSHLPVYEKALEQHEHYVNALQQCGLDVVILDASEAYPDSVFVEDVAVLTPVCAIVTAPGAEAREGEIREIGPTLAGFFPHIERIVSPGTLEGGDVMQIGNHYYIGLSGRTNLEGARQLIDILEKYGMTGSTIPVHNFLHLKTGVTWVGNNTLLAESRFTMHSDFQQFNMIQVGDDERGAANCICLGDKIIMPAGYPKTRKLLSDTGSEVVEVAISEFARIDGGLTCLSLRF